MELFLSRQRGKIDDKGRILIPSSFRNIITRREESKLVAYPSFINQCVEIFFYSYIEKMYQYIEKMDMFSKERDAISTAIFSSSEVLHLDNKGRALIPEILLKFSHINKEILFVGKGQHIELWNPELFDKHYAEARDFTIKNKVVLNKNA